MTTYLNNVTAIYFIHNNYVLLHHFDLVFRGHFFLCSIDNGLRTFPGHCIALSKKTQLIKMFFFNETEAQSCKFCHHGVLICSRWISF